MELCGFCKKVVGNKRVEEHGQVFCNHICEYGYESDREPVEPPPKVKVPAS